MAHLMTHTQTHVIIFFQPICEEPFTYEIEYDDLPKETLKQLIFKETEDHYVRTQEAKKASTEEADSGIGSTIMSP